MKKPKYWRGIEELEQSPEFLEQATKEFPTEVPLEDTLSNTTEESLSSKASRRDFMKVMGFGITAATLSACVEGPVKKAIPYVIKPDEVIPGVANWYASTTPTGLPVLVKTQVGRPIKLEGNPDSGFTGGGMDAVSHGTLLDLYDTSRALGPRSGQNMTEWGDLDADIIGKLNNIKASGGKVRVLSRTLTSPSTKQVISDFLAQFGDGQHVVYDPVSSSAIAKAHQLDFGTRMIPAYHIDRAKVIAGFNCDFLGTWISPAEFAWKYAKNRNPDGPWMSRHFQFESLMSNTGANADLRFPIDPSKEGVVLLNLYNKVARILGRPQLQGIPEFNVAMNGLDKAAADLAAAPGEALVMSGTNDVAIQRVVNALNHMLGSYGATVDTDNPSHLRQGDDEALAELVRELKAGEVSALLLYDANPVYDTPFSADFEDALGKVEISVSFSSKEDESAQFCGYHCPDNHYLESWGDAQQTGRLYSLIQPTINPIFNTRQAQQSLMRWSGQQGEFFDVLKGWWETNLFPQQTEFTEVQAFWDETLRKGIMETPASEAGSVPAYDSQALAGISGDLAARANSAGSGQELVLYEKVSIRDGKYANIPWLQELADPITRSTWDNYLTVPYSFAQEQGYKQNDLVSVQIPGIDNPMELAVVVVHGQALNTLGIALGYGRTKGGKVADAAGGANVYPVVSVANGAMQYARNGVSIVKTGRTYPIAIVQTHDYLYDPSIGKIYGDDFDRSEYIVRETNLEHYKSPVTEGNPYREGQEKLKEKRRHLVTLWDSFFEDPETSRSIHWAMAIDLNKCTGCGACVVSCQTENNVPVVGKQEVMDRRAMHWMRIDRYYSGDLDNPDVAFQPMLCQHCDNAPCETVCPVLATIHSDEGLNQMAYNRCVGTRYCANNCPYKVRRFNWFNYTNGHQFTDINPSQNKLGQLVLNPDVTVRFRGVMEKCSFCVQRLQEAKLRAKVNANSTFARPEANDRSLTACQQSCPTGAIVFGDRNDPNSEIHKLWYRDERKYLALEEVKTLPSVGYMTMVRNRTVEEWEMKEDEKAKTQNYETNQA